MIEPGATEVCMAAIDRSYSRLLYCPNRLTAAAKHNWYRAHSCTPPKRVTASATSTRKTVIWPARKSVKLARSDHSPLTTANRQ